MTHQNDLITIPTIEDVTRRQFMSGALASALLIACGSDDEEAAPQAATRTITHEFGTFEIPTDPQRVVALDGRPSFEHSLALGFKPVAIGQDALVEGEIAPFIDFDADGIPLINRREINFEDLIAVSPDLIIGGDFDVESQLDRLAQIAPILLLKYDDPWRVQLARLAKWLEREETVATVLDEYDAKVESVKNRHRQLIPSTKVGVVTWNSGNATLGTMHTPDMIYHQVLADLGGVEHKYLVDVNNTGPWFSIENVSAFADVDALLAIHFTDEYRASLDAHPLWQTLPAVQRGHVAYSDTRTNYGGVYAAMACLDLFDQLYAKLA